MKLQMELEAAEQRVVSWVCLATRLRIDQQTLMKGVTQPLGVLHHLQFFWRSALGSVLESASVFFI